MPCASISMAVSLVRATLDTLEMARFVKVNIVTELEIGCINHFL